MRIQNNIPAINAYRVGSSNRGALGKSLEKLASGLQINRAADDAAGLAISEKMRAQIRGLDTAGKNVQDGISLLQTAEGALGETHDMLNRMIALATQSSNGTYDDETDRAALQKEFANLCDEIDRIAQKTNFNGIPLLKTKSGAAETVLSAAVSSQRSSAASGAAQKSAPLLATNALTAPAASQETGTKCGDFIVYGDTNDYAFDGITGVLTIKGNVTVEGKGDPTTHTIVVDSGATVNVTLTNVNIDVSTKDDSKDPGLSAFDVNGGTVNLTLEGTNILKGGFSRAGLEVDAGSTLTITEGSNGTLSAEGGRHGAGIGGGQSGDGGTITISGGTVSALGGHEGGAGIGGGHEGDGGTITISGGTVSAKGGIWGAGIGGGHEGDGGKITISGGTVESALSGGSGAGIGGGQGGHGGEITISGGTVESALGGDNSAGIGGGYGGAGGEIAISGGTVESAKGGRYAAGIGSGYRGAGGTITISGGTVESALGGYQGAGIGGGYRGAGGTITISGGTVKSAQGGENAAGIGGGDTGDGGAITISGGTVSAAGGYQGAGIGGGLYGDGGTITISGGTVSAKGSDGSAGIGGGDGGDGGAITISGGTVSAAGGYQGAGIGGGLYGDGGTITISGGTVSAKGGSGGAGIGGGRRNPSESGTITISGGMVSALGGRYGAGIGGGSNGDGGAIAISGGTVSAKGSDGSAGIGGGDGGDGGGTTISGGIVSASGGNDGGAGIGGGEDGDGGTVTISNNSVVFAEGDTKNNAEHIGKGKDGANSGNLTIVNSLVVKGDTGETYGDVTVQNDVTIDSGITITVGSDETLTVTDDATITNNGTIQNDGTIDIRNGNILSRGTIQNNGDILFYCELTINIDGVTLDSNTAYTVKVNGVTQTVSTDSQGVLKITDVTSGATTISLTHGGKTYEGTAKVDGDGSFTLTQKINQTDPPAPPADDVIRFQIGAESWEILDFAVADMNCAGIGIDGLSIANQQQAADALDGVKAAINLVSSHRAHIGALQNRLEYTFNNLSTTGENITAAESRIRDADMTAEYTHFVKQQILSQASQAMQAQANMVPERILALLR